MKKRFSPTGMLAIAADSFGADFERANVGEGAFEMRGDFAVVSVCGPLMQHENWFFDSYESIQDRVQAAFLSPCPAVMLKLCSPGGQVAGAFELASWIRAQAEREGKPVVAYVDGIAASAAYALACAADRIVVPPTGVVGSIGCIQVNVDVTAQDRSMGLAFEMIASGARKTDGNPHVALDESARSAMQGAVNDMAATFFATVAKARSKSVEEIAALEAGVFVGAKAVAAGLADDVMSFSELVMSGAKQITAGAAGVEADMTDEEKAKAALQAIADGDDEKASAKAKKALAAFEDDSDDEKKEEAKAESDDDSKEEKKDDEEKKDADAKATTALARVVSLEAKLAERDERDERAKLLATRPDFSPEMIADLAKEPLASVKWAVKNHPRAVAKGNTVRDARAAMGVTPSLAEAAPSEANELDVKMGLAPRPQAIREEGTRQILGVMTPGEARAELARRSASKKGAA
jgi:signal peptide peptidase SppA